jgi:murein L,D-transpeptidase YafK
MSVCHRVVVSPLGAPRVGVDILAPMAQRCGVFRVDRVVVNKARREMLLLSGESVVRSYRVALGRDPIGHKLQEGDGRTPEGCYRIDRRNPRSRYHLALHISYPNAADSEHARALGVEPGGDIMIHGLKTGAGHPESDWTQGCIAVTDAEMDEIWELVADGTPVEINP